MTTSPDDACLYYYFFLCDEEHFNSVWAIWDTRFALLAVTKALTQKYKTEFSSVNSAFMVLGDSFLLKVMLGKALVIIKKISS